MTRYGRPPLIASIGDSVEGDWLITTSSGSYYMFDMNRRTVTRVSGNVAMRRDSESLKLHRLLVCAIGQPAVFIVDVRADGIPTYRTTSHVLKIEDMGPAD